MSVDDVPGKLLAGCIQTKKNASINDYDPVCGFALSVYRVSIMSHSYICHALLHNTHFSIREPAKGQRLQCAVKKDRFHL